MQKLPLIMLSDINRETECLIAEYENNCHFILSEIISCLVFLFEFEIIRCHIKVNYNILGIYSMPTKAHR